MLEYRKEYFFCGCGREHANPIDEIVIGPGALVQLSSAPERLGLGRNAMLITDEAIMGIMGDAILAQLHTACDDVRVLAYPLPVMPDEKHIFEFLRMYDSAVDFFVAAGTGAVNDITRFLSAKLSVPYLSIPTAPSMDGYSAKVSLLFVDGVKQTLEAIYPKAIYADTDYLKHAPKKLLAAGVGDLAAKITACADWKISHLINDEYYCQESVDKLMRVVEESMAISTGLAQNDEHAVQALTDGLMLSGIVMHWVGSSRPAAGAEHHITHFWGMQSGSPQHLHGIEVAVGTLIMLQTYAKLAEFDFSTVNAEAVAARMPDQTTWRSQVEAVYGQHAPVIFAQQADKTFDKEKILRRIRRIQSCEAKIKSVIADMTYYEPVLRHALEVLGAPTTAAEIGISPGELRTSFLWAKEMRPKYVVLDLAYDLGILEQLADSIA